MKKLFLIVLLLASSTAFAEVSRSNEEAINPSIESTQMIPQESQQSRCDSSKDSLAVVDINKQLERRGCCSHHGGVCGCSSGRATCCDGSLSPSCGC